MTTLADVRGQIAAKAASLHEIFEQSQTPDGLDLSKADALKGISDAAGKAAEVKRRNDELTELGKERDRLADQDAMADNAKRLHQEFNKPADRPIFPGGKSTDEPKIDTRSPGKAFVESASYKGWRRGSGGQVAEAELPALSFKATFTTAGSTLTQFDRQAGMIMLGLQRLTVADLIPQAQTTQNTIRFAREDTFTNAAATVAEGAAKPEASFDTSEADAAVRKIAVVGKVTDEMFADFPALQGYVDGRLRFMVAQREEIQLLTGDGVAPNLLGILQTPNIQTQAKGGDTTPDAIYKAMVLIMTVGFFDPTAAVIHPLDWQDIRLLKDTTGNYIWGSPMDAGPERVWSLPVVITTAMTQNTGLVGAFNLASQIFYREGIRVESTNSNEDDFKNNLIAIRAEQREALVTYRPKAYCTVTGI